MKTDSELIGKFSNIYIMLLYAIMVKDINRVKHFLSVDLYNKYSAIIDNLNSRQESQMYDELNVGKIDIVESKVVGDKELITVRIMSRYMDYIVDGNGNYKSGNNTSRVEKENILVFSKNVNSDSKSNYKCDNCGADLDINFTGICSYCGSVCDISNFDYQLIELETKD